MIQKQVCRLVLTTALSNRAVAECAGMSHNTVGKYRDRLRDLKLTWDQVNEMTQDDLDRRLNIGRERARKQFAEPNWAKVHEEMAKPNVTLTLLHEEYKDGLTERGMSESEFRRRYTAYKGTLNIVMRQPRRPGEELFVDYSGKRPFIVDTQTGAKQYVEMWVGVLGAGRKTFVHCSYSQQLRDFIGSHVKAFDYFGALPATVVPDNLKSAVTSVTRKNGHYINPTYQAFADHYDLTVLPTRPRRPKDKAAVENGVRLAQRWILARLRERTFFSLEELNGAIYALLAPLNDKPMRSRDNRSRNELFLELDLPMMRPLPVDSYEYAEWKLAVAVPKDYHVFFEANWYSVPHYLVQSRVDLRATTEVVQAFHRNQLVATHARCHERDQIRTKPEHQPPAHRAYGEDQLLDVLSWAQSAGKSVHLFLIAHLKQHGGVRSVNAFKGVKRLARDYGNERLELACCRALKMNSISTSSLKSMLARGIEATPLHDEAANDPVATHENVRGAANYE